MIEADADIVASPGLCYDVASSRRKQANRTSDSAECRTSAECMMGSGLKRRNNNGRRV